MLYCNASEVTFGLIIKRHFKKSPPMGSITYFDITQGKNY